MATLINELYTRLYYEADNSGVEKSEKAMTSLGHTTEAVNGVMEKMRGVLELIGASLAIHKVVEFANEWDLAQNKLKSVGLAGEELAEVNKRLMDISKENGASIEANAELYQQLSVSLSDVTDKMQRLTIVDSLNKIFTINGTTTSAAANAMQDLSKGLSGTTVNYREIQSAMRDVPGLQKVILEHFKKLGKDYKEELMGNSYSVREFVKILIDSNKELSEQFAKTAVTLPRAFMALKDTMVEFFGRLGDSSGLRARFTGWINNLADSIEDLSDYFEKNADTVRSIGQAISIFLTMLATRFAIIGAVALAPFIPLIAGMTAVVVAIQDMYVFLKGGKSAFGSFLSKIGLTDKSIDNLRSGVNWFVHSLGGLIKTVLSSKVGIIALAGALSLLAGSWVIGKAIGFVAVITSLGKGIYTIIKALKLWRIAQVALNTVLAIGGILAVILEAPIYAVVAAIAAIAAGIAGLTYIFYRWGSAIKEVANKYIGEAFSSIKSFALGLYNYMTNIFNKILHAIMNPFSTIDSLAKNAFASIKGYSLDLYNYMSGLFHKISSTILAPFKAVKKELGKLGGILGLDSKQSGLANIGAREKMTNMVTKISGYNANIPSAKGIAKHEYMARSQAAPANDNRSMHLNMPLTINVTESNADPKVIAKHVQEEVGKIPNILQGNWLEMALGADTSRRR